MKKVIATQNIKLCSLTIPKGAIGRRVPFRGRLKHLKDGRAVAVMFPLHWKKSFVASPREVQDI